VLPSSNCCKNTSSSQDLTKTNGRTRAKQQLALQETQTPALLLVACVELVELVALLSSSSSSTAFSSERFTSRRRSHYYRAATASGSSCGVNKQHLMLQQLYRVDNINIMTGHSALTFLNICAGTTCTSSSSMSPHSRDFICCMIKSTSAARRPLKLNIL
jgi:hypothetical protein